MMSIDQLESDGQWEEAIKLQKHQIHDNNLDEEQYHRLGRLYQRLGKNGQAKASYRKALSINSLRPKTLNNLAVLAIEALDPKTCEDLISKALAIKPLDAETEALLCNTACELKLYQLDIQSALQFSQRQAALEPSPRSHCNLAVCKHLSADFQTSWILQSKAIANELNQATLGDPRQWILKPQGTIQQSIELSIKLMNLAFARLCIDTNCPIAQKLLLAGLGAKQSYWQDGQQKRTQWQGETTDKLIVWDDEGFGDTIQGLRWIGKAASMTKHLELWLRPSLHALAEKRLRLPPNCTLQLISTKTAPWQQAAPQTGLWYLPVLLGGFKLNQNEPQHAYLERKPSINPKRGIGLVWCAGRHKRPQPERAARMRDVPFQRLLRHAKQWQKDYGETLVSLQLGEDQDPQVAEMLDNGLLERGIDQGMDWDQTASRVENLKLVVTIDTAMAHLCGALGVPCIVLLNRPCDWRWHQTGSACALYASSRLARCHNFQDWEDALEQADQLVHGMLTTPDN